MNADIMGLRIISRRPHDQARVDDCLLQSLDGQTLSDGQQADCNMQAGLT